MKPDNVHLDANGRAKLMDFGIAKTQQVSLTRTGFALGTPHYMAPEMLTGQPATPRVDVYSFGIMLFELLCGKKPIDADTVERIFHAIMNDPIPIRRLEEAGVPEPLCETVKLCTEKDPANRLASFSEVCERLEQYLSSVSGNQTAIAAPVSRRRVRLSTRWLVCALAAAVALAIVVGALLVYTRTGAVSGVGSSASAPEKLSFATGDMVLIHGGTFHSAPRTIAFQ